MSENGSEQKTINRLCERDDLTRDELLALRDARRAQVPVDEVSEVDGWRVVISHHVHTGGHWSAGASKPDGSGWTRERCFASGATEAEARGAVARWIAGGCR